MKLAIVGTRGIPANYGGFETFAEELSTRLAARGHDVTVYGRSNNIRYPHRTYKGVRLVILPTIGTKHLDTLAHTFLSVLHAMPQRFDCILMCNAANAIFGVAPRLTWTPLVLNVDGIERLRKKWGPSARAFYRMSERLATMIPNAIVSDAAVIRDYYMKEYRAPSVMISYGAECSRAESTAELDRLGVRPREYFLYVSRLEPENNAHVVIEAFEQVETFDAAPDCGRRALCDEIYRAAQSNARSANSISRRDLRQWLSRTAIACLRLRSGDRSRRNSSRID